MNYLRTIVAGIIWLAIIAGTSSAVNAAGPSNRTYLVNGIASAVPFIGYGMRNLKKKISGAKLFSYITSAEGNGIIKPNITKDAIKIYAANPEVKINLIGISYGANVVSQVAASLAARGIPVNYVGIIEGTNLTSIKANVRSVDNFVCTNADCTAANVRLSGGNATTVSRRFVIKSSHIALGDNNQVHARVLQQIR